ncbi:unnamed protein product, partial [Meganyctiphanes norvegica]
SQMAVTVQVLVLSILVISVVTGFTIFQPQSVRWQTLIPINVRETGVFLPCPNEGFFQHPANCSRFYRCVDFHGYGLIYTRFVYECPKSLIFIAEKEQCSRGSCPVKSASPSKLTSTSTSIPTTLIPPTGSEEKLLNLLTEKNKLEEASDTLSKTISVLKDTQNILQNLDLVIADAFKDNVSGAFILREQYGTKINILNRFLGQLKVLPKSSVENNLDLINILTKKIKDLLAEINELANDIKEGNIAVSEGLQDSVTSAINQTQDTSQTVEQQKEQTTDKLDQIEEYITMNLETTEKTVQSTMATAAEFHTTEEINTEHSELITATEGIAIWDITNEPIIEDSTQSDSSSGTTETTTKYNDN